MLLQACIASIQGWNEPSGVGSEARQSLPWFAGFAESFTGTMHFMSLYVTPSLSDLYIEVGMLASVSSGPAVHQE